MPIARLLREDAEAIAEHYRQEVASGVEVLVALTADTTARGLAQIGMAFRAALLTGAAVDLALEAALGAPRPIFVAGVLEVTPATREGRVPHLVGERIVEEYGLHAARLSAAGCELVIARGVGAPLEDGGLGQAVRRAAVLSATMAGLPTWALLEVEPGGASRDGEPVQAWARAMLDAGAQAVLVEVPTLDVGIEALGLLRAAHPGAKVGVILAATAGGPDGGDASAVDAWALAAKRLVEAGARVVGGGPGAAPRHLAAFARALRGTERQTLWPGAP